VLRRQLLAAQQTTDVLQISLGDAGFDEGIALSLALALQTAGARMLEVDPRELGVLAVALTSGYSTVLFDNVPGGAGHVLELMKMGRGWLAQAREALFVDQDHNERCTRACLDCLLSFSTQHYAHLLRRTETLALLDGWLGGVR